MFQRTHRIPNGAALSVIAVLALCLQSQACSSSDDAPSATYNYDEVKSLLASSYCGALRDCCAGAGQAYNETLCLAAVDPFLWLRDIPPGDSLTQSDFWHGTYNRELTDQCAAAVHKRMSRCSDGIASPAAFEEDDVAAYSICGRVMGMVDPGDTCEKDIDCRETAEKIARCGWRQRSYVDRFGNPVDREVWLGKCYQITVSKPGESCKKPVVPVDGMYDGYRMCGGESYCDVEVGPGKIGLCHLRKQAGEACRRYETGVYQVNQCRDDVCDDQALTCPPPRPRAGKGEACSDHHACDRPFNCREKEEDYDAANCDYPNVVCRCFDKKGLPTYSATGVACTTGPGPDPW